MGRVRATNTKPEMAVRRMVHGLGYRYRLHARDLPGCPDLVFRGRQKAIFVHGCFWHRHSECPRCRLPKTNVDFWKTKLENNRQRDVSNLKRLRAKGWKVLVVWECQVDSGKELKDRITQFLEK